MPSAVQLGVSLPVDVSGAWVPRGESAAADARWAGFDRDDGLRALDEDVAVAVAVAELAFTQRGVLRAERIAALQGVLAEAAARELAAGQGDQLAVDAVALDLSRARVAAAQSVGEERQAQLRLARLLGRERAQGLVVDDPADVRRRGTSGPLSATNTNAGMNEDPSRGDERARGAGLGAQPREPGERHLRAVGRGLGVLGAHARWAARHRSGPEPRRPGAGQLWGLVVHAAERPPAPQGHAGVIA